MALHLDMDILTAPIPGPEPAGEDLRYTEVYDQIREAKRADDRLDRGEWEAELKRSDWAKVCEICSEALAKQTKDLQIAVWFTEALVHHKGFSGLEFGLELMVRLLGDFWDTMHPEIEDGDLDYRAGSLTYLNEKLAIAVCEVPICDSERTKAYTCFSWEESRLVGFDSGLEKEQQDRRQQMIDEGKVSGEDFASAVNLSTLAFYKKIHLQLIESNKHLSLLDDQISELFDPDPPGLTQLSNAMETCTQVVEKIYTEKKKSEVDPIDDETMAPGDEENASLAFSDLDDVDPKMAGDNLFLKQKAIMDISGEERMVWKAVAGKAGNGHLKDALDQLMASASLAPSERQKNRYLLLVAKLCLRAGRHDLAKPIAEQLYELIESLKLEQWEHPAWIADVIETLYRCLEQGSEGGSDRAATLFQKLCTLNVTKAATYRLGSAG